MRVLTIVGARPQFIKAAPFSRALRGIHQEFLVHTGQHFDDEMSEVFFRQLGIPEPDVNLGIHGGTHGEQTSKMLLGAEQVMEVQSPDWVIVFGDTNSTLAGALAAAKLQIPIAHVEAGLRSFNRSMPEEINRLITDHISSLLFCPTQTAIDNLKREGIEQGITLTGDIMVDALQTNIEQARSQSTIHEQLGLSSDNNYLVATIHRPGNADNPANILQIIKGLNNLGMPVIFPLHPRTRKSLSTEDLSAFSNILFLDPFNYLDMLAVIDRAIVLVTDSGGLQKESYILKTPCVTVRMETEWVETIESGWNRLVSVDSKAVELGVREAISHIPESHPDFYGDGNSASRMVEALF
jgi:UDP-N-acetylglucosamine 2-epimerase